jgi:hypothetical protein
VKGSPEFFMGEAAVSHYSPARETFSDGPAGRDAVPRHDLSREKAMPGSVQLSGIAFS